MRKDLTVVLEHRPGALARLAEATGKAGINIEGECVASRVTTEESSAFSSRTPPARAGRWTRPAWR
jgi:hypothetical protein